MKNFDGEKVIPFVHIYIYNYIYNMYNIILFLFVVKLH